MPRVAPAVKSGEISTEDLGVAQQKPREIQVKDKDTVLTPALVEPADSPHIDKEKMANITFSRELITVRFHESTEENAEKFVEGWNNGDHMRAPRGENITVERRFIETMMRAKPTRFSQKAVLDDLGKVGGYQEIPHTAIRYPFSVVEDKNPLGRAWLQAVLNER